jgi:hypothetical protein
MLGDQIVDQARLGHTQEGSYVLPILMPLTEASPEEQASFWTEEASVARGYPNRQNAE